MGIYLNPGNDGFRESIRSSIYVDKTGLIAYTNERICTKEKYICVSRPRRFGKSMALEMLAAYYSRGCDSRGLFSGLSIECCRSFSEHLNKYDVIFLNMQQFLIEAKPEKVTGYLEQQVSEELYDAYGDFFKAPVSGMADAFRKLYAKTGKKFIFLIDEWDCVVRERQESEELQKQYLDFLRVLLKDQPYVALAYNDENSLGCAISLAYYSARKDYRMIRELPTGRRFADVVFLPLPSCKKPALVIELKYGKSAETAIQQIKARHYTQALEGYTGEILLVGVNYDKSQEDKPHTCVIERAVY